MIQILLVDKPTYAQEALAVVLGSEADFQVVHQANSLPEVSAVLDAAVIDVAVVEPGLNAGDGLEAVREILDKQPLASVLLLTDGATHEQIAKAVAIGATGVLRKTATIAEISDAIRRIYQGEILLTPHDVMDNMRLAAQYDHEEHLINQLTRREREILQILSEGLSDKEIAVRLGISPYTVRAHMARLMGKIGVQSRLAAAMFATRHGLIEVELKTLPMASSIETTSE